MDVRGANWSSNGFVDFLKERSLRIAENVTAEILDYHPFGNASVETTSGCAIQFAFATKNIKEADSKLIECYDPDSGAVSMSVEIKLRYTARPDNRLWWNAHSDKVKKLPWP